MKRIRSEKKVYLLLILITLLMVILLVFSISSMRKDYFDSIGRRAMSFSQITADKLQLSDSEVERLEELDFNILLKDDSNTVFESYVRKFMRSSEVKYVYLLHDLKEDEVKYSVKDDEEDYYGLPAGTPLSTIYLIDAVIDDETRMEDTDYQGYTDKDRYTFLHEEIREIYDSKEANYILYNDEWGTYISGFTPIFSAEGKHIGMVGADIFVDEYIQLLKRRIIVILLFCFLILILIYGMIKVYREIFKIETVMDNLKSRVYYDEMTGLYNRNMLKEEKKRYAELSKENKTDISAIMMDIDSFKRINDVYGHLKGDDVIIAISESIKDVLQGNGQPYRYGGDEFLIILVDKKPEQIRSIAESILNSVREISIDSIEEKFSVSIGVSLASDNKKTELQTLLSEADEMMYQSKSKGGNTISFY